MFSILRNRMPLLTAITVFASLILVASSGFTEEREVLIVELEGPISSGSATFLARGLQEAQNSASSLLIIRLDTPGGSGASMKTMVKSILNSPVPIVVYVAPKGAGAASAGVLITIAAHIAAMAPGTNIGAAHPVLADGQDLKKTMAEKVVNDMASYGRGIAKDRGRNADWVEKAIRESVSVTADEALEKNVIDLIASDLDELLRALDGREVAVQSGKIILKTDGLVKKYYRPGAVDKILMFISNPALIAILFGIGMAGIYFEITHPGAIFPGVIGAISLILFFYSIQTLPVNYAGLMLICLAIILFLIEIKMPSYGLLSLGGIVSLTLGSVMFFEDLGVSYKTIIPFIILTGAFFMGIAWLALSAQMTKPQSGMSGMVGEIGLVRERIAPEGLIFIHGEIWRAESQDEIEEGEKVKVEEVSGLVLKVKRTVNEYS